MSKIDSACNWAVGIANDNSHGYDQLYRWGTPDYDCSSLVISAYEQAGFPIKENGGTYTGNMKNAFVKCGFEAIPYKKGMALKRGDVLLNEKHHTALYLGDGKIVQATSNEKGGIYNGAKGDQTGKEICSGNFYEFSKGWDYVLRYKESEVNTVSIDMMVLQEGVKGNDVKTFQRIANSLGYVGANNKPLSVDGDYGRNSRFCCGQIQQDMVKKGIIKNVDYICGKNTWNYLLKGC